MNYDIAFSYASEQKEIVTACKSKLKKLGLEVFIDTEHPENFVFKPVATVLKQIYDDENIAMVIFLSKEYVHKNFTTYEGHIACDRLIERKRVEVIKLDDAKLEWLPSSLHCFDIRNNDLDYICNALYLSIKGNSCINLKYLLSSIGEFLIHNSNCFSQKIISETCMIFSVNESDEIFIKLNYYNINNSILFFFSSLSTDEFIFPIAEITVKGGKIIFTNKGISDAYSLTTEYISEKALLSDILFCLNKFINVI